MNNLEDHIKPLIDSHNQSVSSKTFVQPPGPYPKCYSELATDKSRPVFIENI